jgi:hypothetical protein
MKSSGGTARLRGVSAVTEKVARERFRQHNPPHGGCRRDLGAGHEPDDRPMDFVTSTPSANASYVLSIGNSAVAHLQDD